MNWNEKVVSASKPEVYNNMVYRNGERISEESRWKVIQENPSFGYNGIDSEEELEEALQEGGDVTVNTNITIDENNHSLVVTEPSTLNFNSDLDFEPTEGSTGNLGERGSLLTLQADTTING